MDHGFININELFLALPFHNILGAGAGLFIEFKLKVKPDRSILPIKKDFSCINAGIYIRLVDDLPYSLEVGWFEARHVAATFMQLSSFSLVFGNKR